MVRSDVVACSELLTFDFSRFHIFGSASLLPTSFSFDSYINGWKGSGQYTVYDLFYQYVCIGHTGCPAHGFLLFCRCLWVCSLQLYISQLIIFNYDRNADVAEHSYYYPEYILFRNFGWLDTYLTFYIPALLACYPFFIFMMVQFIRGIPRDLDESAYMDGSSSLRVFFSILMPLLKPALFSAGIFQLIWTWNQILAMALVSILPLVIIFLMAQKYFVEGIATTGLK